MIYSLFRWFAGIALHWFYSSIQVRGRERIPPDHPLIIAASHHNALVDVLVAGCVIPRRLTLTAKATLVENPVVAWLFRMIGVVPLRRVSDEATRHDGFPDRSRNAEAFRSIISVLEKRGVVLIFPEGKSHSDPKLAPLKTGVARIALAACQTRQVAGLEIIPLGLNFEDKGNPGTAVLAEFGEAMHMDQLTSITVDELTALIATALAAVSLKQPEPSMNRGAIRNGEFYPLSSPLAAWGELTHRYIINYARDRALARSKSPDDPAMLTIIISLILILASYLLQFVILAALTNTWVAAIYVATLPAGAYWAAYRNHTLRVPQA